MIDLPKSLEDIERLISSEVQESIHLDYKAGKAVSRSKSSEISKDVSAFANSDGGTIIYGVGENAHLPVTGDAGVDHSEFTREWLEQIIASNISPRVDGVIISPIPLNSENSIYAVEIPKSFRGPHQAADKKYYKRQNFQSVPMEHYEINDVRGRMNVVPPLVNIDFSVSSGVVLELLVSNIGNVAAIDVAFSLSAGREWPEYLKEAGILHRGIKYFQPGQSYRYYCGPINYAFGKADAEWRAFDVSVRYFNPLGGISINDEFHLDIMDYFGARVIDPELDKLGKVIKVGLAEIKSEVASVKNYLQKLTNITGESGLNLSVPALINLRRLLSGNDQFEKIDPIGKSHRVFQEVLKVDIESAYALADHFRHRVPEKFEEIPGLNDELVQKLREFFEIDS